MIKLTEEQIIDGQNEAYLKAGHNAYFGNGFNAGVEFTLNQVNKLPIRTAVKKQLVTVEFRYHKVKHGETMHTSKTVTIGMYDTFEAAAKEGNKFLESMEAKFELHRFPSGLVAEKERFSRHGGAFRSKKWLVTDMAYLKTPFQFFAKVEELKYYNMDDTLDELIQDAEKVKELKGRDNEED